MLLEFLKDTIGLNKAGEDSGLALVNLPGISLNNFSGIKELGSDIKDLWDEIQNRSLKKLLTASSSSLNKCFKISDLEVIDCLIAEKEELFYTAFWYLLGAETMIERLYSDRVNRWTSIDKPEAEELLAYYTTQYENELSYAIGGLTPDDSDCLEDGAACGGNIMWVEHLP